MRASILIALLGLSFVMMFGNFMAAHSQGNAMRRKRQAANAIGWFVILIGTILCMVFPDWRLW